MQIHNSTYQERLGSTISLTILYVSSCFWSSLVLFVTFHAGLYKTRVNLLLANVTVADLLINLTNLIMQPPNIMSNEKWFACDWTGWITYVCGVEAIWSVPLVVLNRYISIFHQQAFKRIFTTRNIFLMIGAGWLFVICCTLPFHVGGRTGYEYSYENCGINNEDSTIWTVLICLLIVMPTLVGNGVTTYCNFRIFFKLREHAKQKTLATNVVAQNSQLMYLTLLQTFAACFLQTPYLMGKLVPVMVDGNILRQIFPCLYILNGSVNPIATLYVIKPYRNALKKYFRCGSVTPINPAVSQAKIPTTSIENGRLVTQAQKLVIHQLISDIEN